MNNFGAGVRTGMWADATRWRRLPLTPARTSCKDEFASHSPICARNLRRQHQCRGSVNARFFEYDVGGEFFSVAKSDHLDVLAGLGAREHEHDVLDAADDVAPQAEDQVAAA